MVCVTRTRLAHRVPRTDGQQVRVLPGLEQATGAARSAGASTRVSTGDRILRTELFTVEQLRVFERQGGPAKAGSADHEERVRRPFAPGKRFQFAQDGFVSDEWTHAISLRWATRLLCFEQHPRILPRPVTCGAW